MNSTDLIVRFREALEQELGEKLDVVLRAPRYYVDHPLKWLLEGAEKGDSLQKQALINTAQAYLTIASKANAEGSPNKKLLSWCKNKIVRAANVPPLEDPDATYDALADVYAALAEIRALGCLLALFENVDIPDKSGPDLVVQTTTGELVEVEVTTLRMAKNSARQLASFYCQTLEPCERLENITPGIFGEQHVFIHGEPKPGEFTVDNAVHRFVEKALEENKQLKGDKPALLWLDLQFEDHWACTPDEAWPLYVLREGRFRTGSLWLAHYGKQSSTPLLDSESITEGLPVNMRGIRYTTLRYSGYFRTKQARASAVVVLWPRCVVLFENPWNRQPLPQSFLEKIIALKWFDWPRSWVRLFWEDTQTAFKELQCRIAWALEMIQGIARKAQRDW